MNTNNTDVLVVGGGVIGCALAYELATRGQRVIVLERDTVGAHASHVAAGMLAPFSESAKPDATLELGQRSLAGFVELAPLLREETGVDIELRASGSLRVALSEADEVQLRRVVHWQRAQGASLEWLDASAARELEPTLSPSILGAVYAPDEQQVRPRRLLAALSQAAGRHGVRFFQGTPALDLVLDGNRVIGLRTPGETISAGTVVLAAGPWSGTLGVWAGYPLPVTPKRGQIVRLHMTPQPLRRILNASHRYLVPRADGTIVLGGTEEDAGYDTRPSAAGFGYLLGILPHLAPAVARAEFVRVEVGLRPWSADGLPLLGHVPGRDGLLLATGHGRNGILLSLVTADLLTRLIVDGQDGIPASCQASRFATGNTQSTHVSNAQGSMAARY